jgi:hypothetical protein
VSLTEPDRNDGMNAVLQRLTHHKKGTQMAITAERVREIINGLESGDRCHFGDEKAENTFGHSDYTSRLGRSVNPREPIRSSTYQRPGRD